MKITIGHNNTHLGANNHSIRWYVMILSLIIFLTASNIGICASGANSPSEDPIIIVLLALIVILVIAKIGGDLVMRIGLPAVVGELAIGILIGNISLLGFKYFDPIKTNEHIKILSEIGVIILLFQVGLESDLRKMAKVGKSAFLAATLGVIFPILLGWGVAKLFLPNESNYVHLFIGAILCATSVGITARVLLDLGKTNSPEARVILGAAVIDDVLGLIVLAGIQGIITAADKGTTMSVGSIAFVVIKAMIFLFGAIVIGETLTPHIMKIAAQLRTGDMLLVTSVALCFTLAEIAALVGLAPIVGAFAAGLILDEIHWKDFTKRGERSVQDLIQPIAAILVPIFFVRMGAEVDIRTFADPSLLVFAAVLTVAAILGKQACALGVLDKNINRIAVGIGMIPRGEVGLIFAAIGEKLTLGGERVVSDSTYSAVVIMVVLTTMLTPPVLKSSLSIRTRTNKAK